MGTRLAINNASSTASTVAPGVAISRFENQITASLTANSAVSLQMYPLTLAGAAVLVGGGAGASLSVIRLNGSNLASGSEHDVDGGWDEE